VCGNSVITGNYKSVFKNKSKTKNSTIAMAIHHGIWECVDEDASEYPVHVHSDLTYDHPPCRPLDFPSPSVYRCKNTSIQARDHRSGTVHRLRNVIIRSEPDSLGNKPKTAYLVKKKLSKSTYGSLHLCIVLKRISRSPVNIEEQRQDAFDPEFVEWESIDSLAVIKVSAWSKIHAMRGRHLEDPIKEISAMQLLGNYHPHIQGTTEVLQDDNYLYTVMPYLSGGDLYGRLTDCKPEQALTSEDKDSEFFGFQETRARGWFRQLIKVSSFQRNLFQFSAMK
jgi:serine/threonine protein kinase